MEGSQRAMCTVNIVKNVSLLSTLLNISVTTESDDIFPSVVCNSCYITVKKAKANILTSTIYQFAWEAHNDFCEICLEVGGDSSGGRLKRKRKRRPRDDEPTFQRRKVMERISDLDSPEFANFPLDKAFSFLLSIWMTSAVTTVIAFPISP